MRASPWMTCFPLWPSISKNALAAQRPGSLSSLIMAIASRTWAGVTDGMAQRLFAAHIEEKSS